MQLNTYQSRAQPHLFVTTPTAEGQSVICLVDELSALDLQLVRGDYPLPAAPRDACFREVVAAGIADNGYALHGFDVGATR